MENHTDFQSYEPDASPFISPDSLKDGYTYIPGTGFVRSDPAALQRHHLKYIATRVGASMIFYILLSVFITIPVVLLYSLMGLPIGVNFNTMKIYGTQLMLQVVNFTSTVITLGIPALFLWGSFRRCADLNSVFSAPRLRIFPFALPIVLAGSVLSAFAAGLLQNGMMALGYYVSIPSYSIPDQPLEFILTVILLTLIPAILEEILFRGLIMQGLRCFGDGMALAVSSLLFALAHFNLMQDANAMIMGLLIGYFVLRTGSVWTGVILHFTVNAVSLLETLLFRTAFMEQSELVGNVISLIFLTVGFVAFLLFIRKEDTAFSIPLLKNSLLPCSKRATICFGSVGMILAFLLFVFFSIQAGL